MRAMPGPKSSEALSIGARSPLARLFSSRRDGEEDNSDKLEDSIRRVSALVEEAKTLPINSLKAEMKELQQRQARIESLLMTLTRGMRNEGGGSSS